MRQISPAEATAANRKTVTATFNALDGRCATKLGIDFFAMPPYRGPAGPTPTAVSLSLSPIIYSIMRASASVHPVVAKYFPTRGARLGREAMQNPK